MLQVFLFIVSVLLANVSGWAECSYRNLTPINDVMGGCKTNGCSSGFYCSEKQPICPTPRDGCYIEIEEYSQFL